jgi:hypothetical protein
MMRQSETMRAASRLLLNHPIVCLLAVLAAAVVLVVLGPLRVVHAADVVIEGEDFTRPPTGTSLVTDTMLYSNGQALKFTQNVAASHTVTCGAVCDVQVLARGGQTNGSPTLSVNGSLPQEIRNNGDPVAYLFNDVPADSGEISITAGNTGTGRNPFVDVVYVTASDGGPDTTPPDTIITSPPSGSVIVTTVTFEFTEVPDEPGSTFKCKLVGRDSTRTNCSSPQEYTDLTVGTQYTFKVWARDAAGNIDSTPATFTFTPSDGPPTGETVHLIGAGDIADNGDADVATGNLIEGILASDPDARVFTAGDNAYPNGSTSDFQNKYHPAWGSFKNRTSPSPGNHDYVTAGASAYKAYFGNLANVRTVTPTTYYAYTLGSWRIYSLDSNIPINQISNQYKFVRDDMVANNARCELAYYHHATVSTGEHGSQTRTTDIFDLFDSMGGDVILVGHDHNYERFKESIDSSGSEVVSGTGVHEIVVGTGGTGLRTFTRPALPTTVKRNDNTQGILDMALSPTSYTGRFINAPGFGTFTDSFSGSCS